MPKKKECGIDCLIGHTIVDIRPMTPEEIENAGCEADRSTPMVIVLDNKSKIYALADSEGNGFGTMVFDAPDGQNYYLRVKR